LLVLFRLQQRFGELLEIQPLVVRVSKYTVVKVEPVDIYSYAHIGNVKKPKGSEFPQSPL